jgi:hypothetical protein
MKTTTKTQRLVLLTAIAVPAATFLLAQGPLTPPGAPAPIMKTLDQVQPRIPLNATTTPGDGNSVFRISQPGSYYLTGNLTGVVNKHGIEVEASHVTIDLMGFTMDGKRATVNSLSAIFCASDDQFSDITIQNGHITEWSNSGIFLGNSLSGVESVARSVVRHIVSSNNDSSGITVSKDSLVEDCVCDGNGTNGISLGGSRSVARRNICRGNAPAGTLFGGIGLGSLNQTQCVIHDNILIDNGNGLFIRSNNSGHLYFRNQSSGNLLANYSISTNNRGGICVVPALNGAAINGNTSATGSGTTDPFANLSY